MQNVKNLPDHSEQQVIGGCCCWVVAGVAASAAGLCRGGAATCSVAACPAAPLSTTTTSPRRDCLPLQLVDCVNSNTSSAYSGTLGCRGGWPCEHKVHCAASMHAAASRPAAAAPGRVHTSRWSHSRLPFSPVSFLRPRIPVHQCRLLRRRGRLPLHRHQHHLVVASTSLPPTQEHRPSQPQLTARSPRRMPLASAASSSCCTTRFTGRAPKAGS